MGTSPEKQGVLQGTLDILILKTLCIGSMHGYDIAESILRQSEELLRVEEGALYPALHRLELRGLLSSEWGVSANNRRAKFYSLTRDGKKHLLRESASFVRLSGAVLRILEA
ncbi:MAG: PadR family transcriptional regulator [Bryobacteraceae bacterium]|nr:PadR family transcriptional regulator [Bryobacteraceae bacterium]